MRLAEPHELTTPAVPVLAAHLSEDELSRLVPIRFKDITDPLETREPAKGALVQLETGGYVVLFYGCSSNELSVEFPIASNLTRSATEFLREVQLPLSRVFWHRPDVELRQSHVARKISVSKPRDSRSVSAKQVTRRSVTRSKPTTASVGGSSRKKK
jgi:hypothetical protein